MIRTGEYVRHRHHPDLAGHSMAHPFPGGHGATRPQAHSDPTHNPPDTSPNPPKPRANTGQQPCGIMNSVTDTPTELTFAILPSDSLNDESRETATRQLRNELREVGLDAAVTSGTGETPKGAKGVPFDLDAMQISLAAAPVIIPRLIDYIRGWLKNRRDPIRIRISVHDTRVEIHGQMNRTDLDNAINLLTTATTEDPGGAVDAEASDSSDDSN